MLDDLIVLAPCQNIKAAIEGIVAQHQRLGIKPVTIKVIVHPGHDPGIIGDPVSLLRAQQNRYRFALVIGDHEGCGQDHRLPAADLEARIESQLAIAGWEGRSAAVLIQPELEAWVWSDSPHVATALGWNLVEPMRDWLEGLGFLRPGETKPNRPKDAVEAVMEHVRKSRTSAIYSSLAANVSFRRCTDPSFSRLCGILQGWFAPQG